MFREGARTFDPNDLCPQCGEGCCHFASDFRMMGQKQLRVCTKCHSVSINGKKVGDVEVHILTTPQGSDAGTVGS
jgi:hypothetical protein